MKAVAVFPAILVIATGCYTHLVKNTCLFPNELSVMHPDGENVLPNLGHNLNALLNLPSESSNDDEAIKIASPSIYPKRSTELIETSRSHDAMPEETSCFERKLEAHLDDNEDLRNGETIEIAALSELPTRVAKVKQAARSNSVAPNLTPCMERIRKHVEQLSDIKYLKNRKTVERALPNMSHKGSVEPEEVLKTFPLITRLKTFINGIHKQKEHYDDTEDHKNVKPIEMPPTTEDTPTETLKEYLKPVVPDLAQFKDITRRQQEHFGDEYLKHTVNPEGFENFYINEYYNYEPKASSSFNENY